MLTCAVIVGASEYLQREIFSPLPGAAKDAIWFERFLLRKGIPSSQILTLTGASAKKSAVLDGIASWAADLAPGKMRLFILFSGHGGSLPLGDGVTESVLFCYDTSIKDRLGTAITPSELLQSIAICQNVEEAYLFVDACYMATAPLVRQLKHLAGGNKKMRTFLCLIASDGNVTTEGISSDLGEFSSSLLSVLDFVDSSEAPSLAGLLHEIPRRARVAGHDCPESICFGDLSQWPFNEFMGESAARSRQQVYRTHGVNEVIRALRSRRATNVLIIGESGSGKSVLVQQVHKELGVSPIVRFSKDDRTLVKSDVEARVMDALAVAHRTRNRFNVEYVEMRTGLSEFASKYPHSIVVVDGAENVPHDLLSYVFESINDVGFQVLSTHLTDNLEIVNSSVIGIRPFSWNEAYELSVLKGASGYEEVVKAYSSSKGNPLCFLSSLFGNPEKELSIELQSVARLIFLSCGICDYGLFAAVFEINREDVETLARLGLLIQTADKRYVLHDSVRRENTEISTEEWRKIFVYWRAEFERENRNVAACVILELLPAAPQYAVDGDVIEDAMSCSEFRLGSELLVHAALAACKSNNHSALTIAINILSRRGRADLLEELLQASFGLRIDKSNVSNVFNLRLSQARASWWRGDYDACEAYASHAMSEQHNQLQVNQAILEFAIARFFKADWDKVIELLDPLCSPAEVDLRTVGWAQLILGTTLGIRGLDDGKGRRLLRSAMQVLRATNDSAGLAISKGNLGEILWKEGQYLQSETELLAGLELAVQIGMEVNQLEARRNLVQLYMRWLGPDAKKIDVHIEILLQSRLDAIGKMEMMQVSNTLATYFLYKGNTQEANLWLSFAADLTLGNEEYDIYTKSNLALICAMTEKSKQSGQYLEQALAMCEAGRNLLAIDQIRHDFVYCLTKRWPGMLIESIKLIDESKSRLSHDYIKN